MKPILDFIVSIFKLHKKKMAFLLASIVFWFLTLFPYDDLSDFVTLKVSQLTQSNVYLQFDGMGLGLLPQPGLQMDNVVIESVYAPSLAIQSLGVAPNFSLLLGRVSGKAKAYGLLGGDATVDLSPSNELDIDGPEYQLTLDLENLSLKETSQYLKKSMKLPFTMGGKTQMDTKVYVDPSFRKQPKGDVNLVINKLEIPSSNIPFQGGLSMSFPALKLSNLVVEGSLNDGKLFIKEGKIGQGDKGDNLYGQITGDLFVDIRPGGRLDLKGYDLKVNLNISDNLKRQLSTVLTFIDLYQGIGTKYKFDSLKGVRYSMRLTARNMNSAPRVSSY